MSLKDADLDFLVLQYLKKKGFADAEAAFKAEAKLHGVQPMALSHHLDIDKGTIENLLLYDAADNQPDR